MLTALQLGNFKSWREVNVALAPITGFFGTNSSGKSSLLQALLLMSQSIESSDPKQIFEFGNEKSLVSLGSFDDLIFSRNNSLELLLGVHFESNGNEFRLKSIIRSDSQGIGLFAIEFQKNHDFAEMYEQDFLQKATKFYHPPLEKFHDPNRIGESVENEFAEIITDLMYLGPIRETPKRTYLWTGAAPSNVGKAGENTIAALLAARVGGNKVDGIPLENYLAEKLKDLGLIDSFRLEELREGTNIFRVLVRRTPESPEVSLTDVGFGVSQVLPVLVLCYYVPEGSTILLEQPELHLHPSVQSGIADIFIDAYQKRGVQIILESHSEHLLRRLQRRIAEEAILTSDVNLYFCRLEHGESKLESLEIDEYGQIHNYPTDFFGDEFAEIAATTKKIMERKKAKIST
jgi:predicted ATPase